MWENFYVKTHFSFRKSAFAGFHFVDFLFFLFTFVILSVILNLAKTNIKSHWTQTFSPHCMNGVNRLIKNTKASYFQEIIGSSKNNSNEMWKNINQLIGKTSKTTNVAAIKLNEQIFTNICYIIRMILPKLLTITFQKLVQI